MDVSELINTGVRRVYTQTDPTNQGCISDSLMNEYVPFFSAFGAEFKRVGDVRYNIYQTPPSNVGSSSTNKTAYFKNYISNSLSAVGYLKGEHRYEVMKNCIFKRGVDGTRDKMLYCLAIKTDYLFNGLAIDFNQLDYTKLVILLDRDFVEAADKRLMYNFVKREVLQPLIDLGIDMVVTNDVNRWCFKDSASPMNFNTMSEMREFLNNLSNNIIDGITGRERPAEIAPPEPQPADLGGISDPEALRIFNELRAAEGLPEIGEEPEDGDDWDDDESDDFSEQLEESIGAELEADRNRREAVEFNRELAPGRDELEQRNQEIIRELGTPRQMQQYLNREEERDRLRDREREELARQRGREIHERMDSGDDRPGVGNTTFTIPFSEDWLANPSITRDQSSVYTAGFDPFINDTTRSAPPVVYITEDTGAINEHGQPIFRTRAVEPNLTGGVDISYGARRREDLTANPASVQRDPVVTYTGRPDDSFLNYRGQGNPPAGSRQELSREDLWAIPTRETQSQEETQERDQSADTVEDDGVAPW